MNRTTMFLGLAGALALVALVIGPRFTGPQTGGGTTMTTTVTNTTTTTTPPPVAVVEGSIRMEARLSHPYIGTGMSDVFATVDLTGVQVPGAERSPVNLSMVIDRSGSMAGEKLAQAKQAARKLVEQLGEADRLAIVHFGSEVRVMRGGWATPENKRRMLTYIDGIFDDGGTNIGEGLEMGKVEVLKANSQFKVNRIILMSDGQPTEGVTSISELEQLARQIRAQGVTVSSIGLGTDFNEDLMQSLAENGSGAYAYLRDGTQLATIFQKDLQQASTTIARDVELSLALPEGVELGEVLGYQSRQEGRTVHISMTDFSAGQVERVVIRLRVGANQVGKPVDVTGLKLAYQDLLQNRQAGAQAQLSAMVTDRREEIAAKQDKQATVYAARARSAANTAKAAEAFKNGDRGGALRLLNANKEIFNDAAAVAGAPAVQKDMDEQSQVSQDFEAASTPEEVQHQVKSAKKKARMDYGKMSSTY